MIYVIILIMYYKYWSKLEALDSSTSENDIYFETERLDNLQSYITTRCMFVRRTERTIFGLNFSNWTLTHELWELRIGHGYVDVDMDMWIRPSYWNRIGCGHVSSRDFIWDTKMIRYSYWNRVGCGRVSSKWSMIRIEVEYDSYWT